MNHRIVGAALSIREFRSSKTPEDLELAWRRGIGGFPGAWILPQAFERAVVVSYLAVVDRIGLLTRAIPKTVDIWVQQYARDRQRQRQFASFRGRLMGAATRRFGSERAAVWSVSRRFQRRGWSLCRVLPRRVSHRQSAPARHWHSGTWPALRDIDPPLWQVDPQNSVLKGIDDRQRHRTALRK